MKFVWIVCRQETQVKTGVKYQETGIVRFRYCPSKLTTTWLVSSLRTES